MKLSVVIPVYNEINTINTILGKVYHALTEVEKEIIIVDDGSKDGTREWLVDTFKNLNETVYFTVENEKIVVTEEKSPVSMKIIFHEKNQGKGAGLRTGFANASHEVIIIQDADLEYDPKDWQPMWDLVQQGHADVVYGSRFYGRPHRVLYFHHLLANKLISNLINLFCNTTLSDIEVCYKMFKKEVLKDMNLTCNDFGFEVEFTMKVALARIWKIYEVGISYYGRTYEEGKKINWKDGVKALWYILKFRLIYRRPKNLN